MRMSTWREENARVELIGCLCINSRKPRAARPSWWNVDFQTARRPIKLESVFYKFFQPTTVRIRQLYNHVASRGVNTYTTSGWSETLSNCKAREPDTYIHSNKKKKKWKKEATSRSAARIEAKNIYSALALPRVTPRAAIIRVRAIIIAPRWILYF